MYPIQHYTKTYHLPTDSNHYIHSVTSQDELTTFKQASQHNCWNQDYAHQTTRPTTQSNLDHDHFTSK